MAVIALISCTKSKQEYGCAAKDLYSKSTLFRRSYELASLVADKIYILSAKYGLVGDTDYVEPYDETLNNKSFDQRREWAFKVIGKLEGLADTENDQYIILAGRNYYEHLLPHIKSYWLPLEGLGLYERPSELMELIEIERSNNHAYVLHKLFTRLPRFNWRDIDRVPYDNGIYIMFEADEEFMGMDRITRVGSHKSQGRLKLRLKNHFLDGNKDGSIFRKNIGRAILNNERSPYLEIWNLNLSVSGNKEKYDGLIDYQRQRELERSVSSYLKDNFSFACIPIEDDDERLRLEEGLIASLNREKTFTPGGGWFGLKSPISAISGSGLWNVQGLDGRPLSDIEMERIKLIVRFGAKGDRCRLKREEYRKTGKSEKLVSTAGYKKPVRSSDIKNYINTRKQEEKTKGNRYIDLVSGDIHRQLGMKNRMPQVCNSMYQLMSIKDEVLKTTPSGYSSTIKIRYFLV